MRIKGMFMILLFAFILTACGKNTTTVSEVNEKMSYTFERCNVPDLVGSIRASYLKDGCLYNGIYKKGTPVNEGRYRVNIYNPKTNINESVILQWREDMVFWKMYITEEGKYRCLFLTLADETNEIDSLWINTFDSDGELLEELDIYDELDENRKKKIDIESFCFDEEGNLFFDATIYSNIGYHSYLYRITSEGKGELLNDFKNEEICGISDINGRAWAVVEGKPGECSLYELTDEVDFDKATEKFQADWAIGYAYLCGGEQDILIQTRDCVYLYNTKTGKQNLLFGIGEVGLLPGKLNMGRICRNNDSFYVVKKVSQTEDGRDVYDWVKIFQSNETDNREPIIIAVKERTTAIDNMVVKYNDSNEKYKIEIKKYECDDNGISTNLLNDIIAGNIPDIIDAGLIDMNSMLRKGMIQELNEYLDADEDISADSFVGKSLEIYSREGKIYALPSSLAIITYVGKEKTVNGRSGWNMEEFHEFRNSLDNPESATKGYSKTQMLQIIMEMSMDHFIDWENRTCTFQNKEFEDILQFANLYPSIPDELQENWSSYIEACQNDEMVLIPSGITDVSNNSFMSSLFGEKVSYIGLPMEYGNGILLSDVGDTYVISSKSENKEEAWKVLRSVVLNKTEGGIPALKSNLEAVCKKAMEKNMVTSSTGDLEEAPLYTIDVNDYSLEIFAATQENIDEINMLINESEPAVMPSYTIIGIVVEEAGAYFANQKSLEEVTSIIQNRVENYLNE